MKMEISCLTRTGPGIKNCFCYMVYLLGMPYQFEKNVINAFYNKFRNQFGKFLKRSWFFALVSEKNGGYTCLTCYFF